MLTKTALDRLYNISSGKIQCTKYEKNALTRAALANSEYLRNEFDREAFVYRYVHGMSWERIANVLCSTTGSNVARRVRYAIEQAVQKQLASRIKTAAANAAAIE